MTRFGIDYNKITLPEVKEYDIVIIEQDHYTRYELKELAQSRTKILGYLSLSEVHPSRSFFHDLRETEFLGKNENWNSYYINLEDSTARSVILDEVLPGIMKHGLDGLLLDTIDGVAPYTGKAHMQDEMVDIIREIRHRYPEAFILQNGGFFLLDETHEYVDAVMVESIATEYDFRNQQYNLRSDSAYKKRVDLVNQYSNMVGGEMYLVDYVNSRSMADSVRMRLDSLTHSYYLDRIQLDSLQFIRPKWE